MAAVVVSVGAVFFVIRGGGKKRRPTQHDLDPTLKKNQIRITTQKKAFRREDLPPEYLATLQRRDIVEIPMGAPRPEPVSLDSAENPPILSDQGSGAWLPDHLKPVGGNGKSKKHKKPVR